MRKSVKKRVVYIDNHETYLSTTTIQSHKHKRAYVVFIRHTPMTLGHMMCLSCRQDKKFS